MNAAVDLEARTHNAVTAATAHIDVLVERLRDFVAIPSVSSDPGSAAEMEQAASWAAAEARRWGAADARVVPTNGAPLVLARWASSVSDARRVVVYCHYDVQPVEPLEAWSSPPFELTAHDGHLYGRGAADDKGPILAHLAALAAWVDSAGGPPVEVTLLLDGEEESGSVHLPAAVESLAAELATDLLVVSDTSILGEGRPALCYGLRGTCALEVALETADHDLHSGRFGGLAPNAVHELARLLTCLHDDERAVAVPAFLAPVEPLDAAERARLEAAALDAVELLAGTGVQGTVGAAGTPVAERVWASPSIDVNGIEGGHTGAGSKTVIPSRATAKVSARLVPGQDPETAARVITDHLRAHAPDYVRLEIGYRHGGPPLLTSPDGPDAVAARRAYQVGYGVEAALNREGGSVPVVSTLAVRLSATPLLLGFGLPDQAEHAPNERLSLLNLERAVRTFAAFWGLLPRDRAGDLPVAGDAGTSGSGEGSTAGDPVGPGQGGEHAS